MGATRWLVAVVAAVGVLGAQELTTLTPELAGQAVGQMATVCGVVAGVSCRPGLHTALVFRTGAGAPGFEVAIAAADRDRFEAPLEGRYFGQSVCATGTVLAVPTGHRIRVRGPDQIQVTGPARPAPTPFADVAYWGCDGRAQLPRIVREVKPQYTATAMRAQVHGTIELQAIVDRDGSVRHVEVFRSLDPGGLDEQAVKAVEQWRFEPGRRDGVAVPVAISVELTFTLAKKK